MVEVSVNDELEKHDLTILVTKQLYRSWWMNKYDSLRKSTHANNKDVVKSTVKSTSKARQNHAKNTKNMDKIHIIWT